MRTNKHKEAVDRCRLAREILDRALEHCRAIGVIVRIKVNRGARELEPSTLLYWHEDKC